MARPHSPASFSVNFKIHISLMVDTVPGQGGFLLGMSQAWVRKQTSSQQRMPPAGAHMATRSGYSRRTLPATWLWCPVQWSAGPAP